MPDQEPPPPEALQFTRAEPAAAGATNQPRCVACKSLLPDSYFHVQGRQVCPACAQRIEAHQQPPPAHSLLKSALYGGAAAIAGCILYAVVEFVTGWEIGILAIVVGYMVGKAIRHASGGLGGRPQQILAVILTYFAITFSYVGVAIAHGIKDHPVQQQASGAPSTNQVSTEEHPTIDAGTLVLSLAWLGIAAPFLALSNPMNLISLFIIFIALRQAWVMTGRSNLVITGPYQTASLFN